MTVSINALPGDLEFTNLINKEARNEVTIEEAGWLRDYDVVESWRAQLVMLLNKVEAQLSHHKAERAAKRVDLGAEQDRDLYLAYIKQAEQWRANALWFRKILLDRLIEAKAIIAYNRSMDFPFEYESEDIEEEDTADIARYEAPHAVAGN